MRSRNVLDGIHFALRLKALYTRLTFNPWRRTVLFIGDQGNIPYNSSQKCFIHVLQDHQSPPPDKHCCFSEDGLLPFSEDSIDMIVCDLAVLPRPSLEVFLEEAQRVLNSQGKLILTYNNAYSPYYFWKDWKSTYSHSKLRRLLKKHKLIILKSFFQSFIGSRTPRSWRSCLIRWERLLRRLIPSFANKITLLIVKETDFYQPLPAYLRLSKKLTTSQPMPAMMQPFNGED